MPANPEEQALIQKLQNGDESVLGRLMQEYQGRVYGLALRLTGSREDAQEVLQDVFLAVFQKIGSFRGDSKLSSWIYRITTNAALMKLRKRPKVASLPLAEELGPDPDQELPVAAKIVDWSNLPSDQVHRKELVGRIEKALEQLPPDYRSVFVLRDVQGLTAQEAREILNISVPALKSRLHRARLFMRKQLIDLAQSGQIQIKEVSS